MAGTVVTSVTGRAVLRPTISPRLPQAVWPVDLPWEGHEQYDPQAPKLPFLAEAQPGAMAGTCPIPSLRRLRSGWYTGLMSGQEKTAMAAEGTLAEARLGNADALAD